MVSNPQPCWRDPRILSLLLLVFATGAVVGGLALYTVAFQRIHAAAPPEPLNAQTALHHFQKELDLTPEQSQKLTLVLDDFFQYYHTLQGQMDEVKANGKKQIMDLLNEDQKRKFEKVMADLQKRSAARDNPYR